MLFGAGFAMEFRCPLKMRRGNAFEADILTVHQPIQSLTVGPGFLEPATEGSLPQRCCPTSTGNPRAISRNHTNPAKSQMRPCKIDITQLKMWVTLRREPALKRFPVR